MKSKLLYVDDEFHNLSSFKAVFRRDYIIDTVNSTEKALEYVSNNKYKAIISDQRMPLMTGVDFFQRVRVIQPESIRIILTGYSDYTAVVDSINKGHIYYYISKPWKSEELKMIIDRAIETYDLKIRTKILERENMQAQFQILREQINPHFLFNSLNVLGSLIQVDPSKAILFTREFSNIYRNILELKNETVVSIGEELDFLHSYMQLQMLRFEGALFLNLDIPEEVKKKTLPPFSLQMVVENALKHNVVSIDRPLHISICVIQDFISVKNNLQQRSYKKDSTGTGLSNIRSRYQLIGSRLPIFEKSEKVYRVHLPIID